MTTAVRIFACALATAALAYGPKPASAYVGPLLGCSPYIGTQASVVFSPGLECSEAFHRFSVSALLSNCFETTGADVWDVWAAGRYGSRISGSGAESVASAKVTIKGSMFGSCNFYDGEPYGSRYNAAPSASGKLYLYNALGGQVNGGRGYFFARIVDDFDWSEDPSYRVFGIMTKGFAAGAKINVKLAIDLGSPYNGQIIGCNQGALCPPSLSGPQTALGLLTGATSYLEIYFGSEKDCTGVGTPFVCCTGQGTGSTCQGL